MNNSNNISLNGKNHEDLDVADNSDKRKDLAIICRNAGYVLKDSSTFELNLASLTNVNYKSLVSLLIFHDSFCGNIKPKEILTDIGKKLPESRTNIICMVSDFFCTPSKDDKSKLLKPILAYFFVSLAQQNTIYEAVLFNANFTSDDTNLIDKEGDRFCDQLGLLNCQYDHSVLLLFGNSNTYFPLTSILKRIKTKVPKQHEMNWMYIFTDYIQVVNSEINIDDITNIIGLRITGESINSCNVSFTYQISVEDFLSKLKELKQNIKLKRHSFGFLYFPKCLFDRPEESANIPGFVYSDRPELVENYHCDHKNHQCCLTQKAKESISEIFPNIPFLGLFYYSMLSNEKRTIIPEVEDINCIFEGAGGYSSYKYGSVMIVTYD